MGKQEQSSAQDQVRTTVEDVRDDVEDVDIASIEEPTSSRHSHHSTSSRKTYHYLSHHILALLIPFSIFGVLARLGIQALTTYNGQSFASLTYVQATGCLVMGFALHLKEPISDL